MLEPPVSWLNSSSGRALARVTRTRSMGTSISSAISMAVEVVIPWPTSARGRANDTVPSSCTSTVIRPEVGRAAAVITSFRSASSVISGEGMPSAAARGAEDSSAAATSVGAARTYPRKRRRPGPRASDSGVIAVPSLDILRHDPISAGRGYGAHTFPCVR